MINAALILGATLLLTACGSADCSCEEVVYKKKKWYQTGLHKEGDRVKAGQLFTGTCETLNQNDEVIERGKFENGYALTRQKWAEVDGELVQTLDMEYKKNRSYNGFRMKIEDNQGFVYPIEFWSFKDGKDAGNYSMDNGYGKTVVSGYSNDEFFESDCLLEGYDIHKFELLNFLNCLKQENLPKFFVIDRNNVQKEFNETKKEQQASVQQTETIQQVEEQEVEDNEVTQEQQAVEEEYVEYYTVKDPDGYSNLRKTPGGEILMRVNEGELFEVLGEEDKHKKVKLSDGTIGYIHVSRVVKN